MFSLPAGLLLQGVDRLLIGKQQREEMRRKNYNMRCKKREEWLVRTTDVQPWHTSDSVPQKLGLKFLQLKPLSEPLLI